MSRERITVNELTEASELAAFASNPAAVLDVTRLDLRRLPEHVKAGLYTEATTFSTPQLKTSGKIDAGSATSFSAPQLQKSGYIDAGSATSFSAPQLQKSGHIYAPNATSFSVPQLQTSGDIDARSAASVASRVAAEHWNAASERALFCVSPAKKVCA